VEHLHDAVARVPESIELGARSRALQASFSSNRIASLFFLALRIGVS
jgi:hypothetical protein